MKLLFDDRALQTDLVRTDRIVPIASFAGLEILTLRHQLNILRRKSPKRPTFGSIDRLVFTGLYGLAPSVLSALAIVRPKTVIHWHREADRRRGNRSLGVTRSTKGKWRTRRNILCFVSIRQSQAAGKDVAPGFPPSRKYDPAEQRARPPGLALQRLSQAFNEGRDPLELRADLRRVCQSQCTPFSDPLDPTMVARGRPQA
jgi:hypothetical protein